MSCYTQSWTRGSRRGACTRTAPDHTLHIDLRSRYRPLGSGPDRVCLVLFYLSLTRMGSRGSPDAFIFFRTSILGYEISTDSEFSRRGPASRHLLEIVWTKYLKSMQLCWFRLVSFTR